MGAIRTFSRGAQTQQQQKRVEKVPTQVEILFVMEGAIHLSADL
jgi:hypothetical protein